MRKNLTIFAIIAALAGAAARAATVDPSTLADGTYTGTVEKVIDSKHVLVKMNNGNEVQLSTDRAQVSFDSCKENDKIMLSLLKGLVAVKVCSH